MNTKTNVNELRSSLSHKLANDGKIFAAYLMLGYPDLEASIEAMKAVASQGVDVIEIGIPFSDPIADGPTIQHAGDIALKNGTAPKDAWVAANEITRHTKAIPLVMTYGNIPMQYGFKQFAQDAYQAGIRGIILPDVPPELYPQELNYLGPVFLTSPLTDSTRLQTLITQTHGFLYFVSHLGITGEQKLVDSRLRQLVAEVKILDSSLPKLMGFGINSEKTARNALSFGMDGVVVGSALLQALGDKANITQLERLTADIAAGLTNEVQK